jgi:subfamily B ATP-binding cassette protein MsbA
MAELIALKEKFTAIRDVATYRPVLTGGIVSLSVLTAILEGVGVSFILPIIEFASGSTTTEPGRILAVFISIYELIGLPFTRESP